MQLNLRAFAQNFTLVPNLSIFAIWSPKALICFKDPFIKESVNSDGNFERAQIDLQNVTTSVLLNRLFNGGDLIAAANGSYRTDLKKKN